MEAKQFKKVLKQVSFPNGKHTTVYDGWAKWEKRHGHGGGLVLARVREAAEAAGFTSIQNRVSADATGDRVTRGGDLQKTLEDGTVVTVSFFSHYGQTAWENLFTLTVSAKKQ
jgi:hypothetical protein